jgi:hypothetical protein
MLRATPIRAKSFVGNSSAISASNPFVGNSSELHDLKSFINNTSAIYPRGVPPTVRQAELRPSRPFLLKVNFAAA